MASCECCWRSKQPDDSYEEVVAEHEAYLCVCTKDTIEGKRARAGQFWDETTQTDTRERSDESSKG